MTVVRLVRRWWYLVLPMLLVTAGLALLVAQSVPISYEARGTLLVQPAAAPPAPADSTIPATTVNPFGGAGSSETFAARLIATVLSDDASTDALKKAGADDFTVKQATTKNDQDLPLIEITATSTSAEGSLTTVRLVADAAGTALQDQQAASGVDPAAMITLRPLLADPKASPLYGGRLRAGIAVGSLGLAATLSMPFLMEGISRTRRREASEWTEQLYGTPALPASREAREPAEVRD